MRHKILLMLLGAYLILGCQLIEIVPVAATEIPLPPPSPTPTLAPAPTATPVPAENTAENGTANGGNQEETQAQSPENSQPRRSLLSRLNTEPPTTPEGVQSRALPNHGLILAFLMPLIVFGIPWVFLEIFIVRYVQPRGLDLTEVLVKAQDGLFIEAVVSMTARRRLSLASTRMTWSRVSELVEKTVEQELIDRAIRLESLTALEQNLKTITDHLQELDIIKELDRDFGLEVLRFNIEIQYTPETVTALNDRAEASAGGAAYLAFAAAAHLDPDSTESRELYSIFQQTTSTVDAARNLGGGITSIANLLKSAPRVNPDQEEKDD